VATSTCGGRRSTLPRRKGHVGRQVALMTCSMAMCGFINMSIVKTGAVLVSQREEAHFLQRCRAFVTGRATPRAVQC
jgi:hypothetical protein